MAAGLASRKTADMLPDIVNVYLGDALWLMIFFGAGFLFKNAKTASAALIALVFCFLIECSQLYHAPWIDNIRAAPLGGLILGYGFLWSDLLAYVLGVSAGAAGEITKKTAVTPSFWGIFTHFDFESFYGLKQT
ncbi:ribosomal maturation YjgA family protein [Bacillus licheniformis]|uniref:ribosomal maturation YjgA family protein n=1 Tax=Bacillus licheniformis TaxID=1402 RepID=UPI00128EAD6A|nr:DUF2809 domain-containing protein [Bacillus licheniformis]